MKKTLLILLASIGLGATAFSQIPTNGLVGYYPFSGNPNDLSGSGNNGTVHGASLTTDRFGQPNSAYQFVGNDNNTVSYIIAGYNNLPAANSPRTISVWLTNDTYPVIGGSLNDGHPIVAYGTPTTNSAIEILYGRIFPTNDFLRFTGFDTDMDLPITYSLQTWYNVVATFDGTTASLYVNDTLLGSGSYPSWNTVLDSLLIGCQTPRTRFHNGKIDDIRIYDRVLNTTEITSLFNESVCIQTIYDTVRISVTDTLIIDAELTGILPPNNINTIRIFPNPAATHIIIDNGDYNSMSGYTLRIDNSLGQTVFTSLINQQQFSVNLSTWTGNGTYFVYVIDQLSNTIDVRKIVIQ